MRRRLLLTIAALCSAAGLALAIAPPALGADSADVTDVGWWWRAQTGVGPRVPGPPDVADDQLLVESGPDGARAYAAVAATVPAGSTGPVLTMRVASDQGGADAVLLACPAGAAWTGTDAGVWADAPPADCDAGTVVGTRAADGTSWRFELGPLQFADRFNVVITPAADASGAQPSYRLVFDDPAGTDVATSPAPAPEASTTTSTSSAPPTTSAPATTAAPATAAPPTTVGPVGTAPPTTAPAPPPAPALEPELQGSTFTAPARTEATTPAPADDDEASRTPARMGGLAVAALGLAGGAVTWRGGGAGGPAATDATPVDGGLGRFRRERTIEPDPVS